MKDINHKDRTVRGFIARGLDAVSAWLRPSSAEDTHESHEQPETQQRSYPLSVYHEKIAKHVVCKSCRKEFPITVGELTFLAMKGYPEFKHCQPCRRLRRQQRQEIA